MSDDQEVLYGLIVTGSEQRTDAPGKAILTHHGDKFWVVIEPEGWVPATSTRMTYESGQAPYDLKVWKTRKEAEDFGKKWKGHPWWCSPIGFQVVKVQRKFKQVSDGYRLLED